PINLFIGSADELFGPITTIQCTGHPVTHIPWSASKTDPLQSTLKVSDWERINDVHRIISDANKLQQSFSSKNHATLWCAVPALKELQTSWEVKKNMTRYMLYHEALARGLAKIGKYYNRLNDKPVYVLALGKSNIY
ncbi:hypothetical protein SCLCIDRAFT_107416, partial [Scleroderma citrinum Foug A]